MARFLSGRRAAALLTMTVCDASAHTPHAIVMRLNTELHAILAMPNTRERLAALGLEPVRTSPEEHAAEIKTEFARWTPITKATGMRID